MPVIINEFEIVSERKEPAASAAAPAGPAADLPAPLHPQDIARIMREQKRRLARLRAD